jgi:hypothetical protein
MMHELTDDWTLSPSDLLSLVLIDTAEVAGKAVQIPSDMTEFGDTVKFFVMPRGKIELARAHHCASVLI